MGVKYEIRIRESIDGIKYFWELTRYDKYGEEIVITGYGDTMDLAYKQAKKIYDEFVK